MKPLILLTNDDGIFSEGLEALERVLPEIGDLYVVAPDKERNATSHSLTLKGPVYVNPLGKNRFSTTGTPTDCVNIGIHRLVPRKPDLVVSGINIGGNLSEDVTYSGTVAAALEARLLGIPSLALSLASRSDFFFVPAARVGCDLARWVLTLDLPPGVFLNVNVPNLVDGSGGRIRWTRLGRKFYGDFLKEGVDEDGRPDYRYGSDALKYLDREDANDADWKAVEQGYVSVTPLHLDTTDENYLEFLKAGNYGETHLGQPGACSTPEKHG